MITSPQNGFDVVVLSLSLQSLASIAVRYNMSIEEAAERLASFFHDLGVDYVLDIAVARHICLVESARELAEQRKRPQGAKTLLSSFCPGFVCYAEKSQGEVLVPLLSRVKSPQQIMGLLVKTRLGHIVGRTTESVEPKRIYHVTLMPCYDKKLEASRLDNRIVNGQGETPEVDCVITPIEVDMLLQHKQVEALTSLPRRKLDLLFGDLNQHRSATFLSHVGTGSGGYADNLFRYLALEHLKLSREQSSAVLDSFNWKTVRNNDYLELKLYENGTNDNNGDKNQKVLLSFAILQGFRNVQNLVSKVKRKTLDYDYVEVAACPKGCLNGGAQLRPDKADVSASELFDQVNRLYQELPKCDAQLDDPIDGAESLEGDIEHKLSVHDVDQYDVFNRHLYRHLDIDHTLRTNMRTQFKAIEKTFNILNSNW